SSRRRHTRFSRDWSSDVCSSDLSFPGRGVLDRLLVIPLAVPTYIVAYCYVDLLGYAGPVQGALRAFFGWATPRDYWFPDVRSTRSEERRVGKEGSCGVSAVHDR